jgi:hypothetical protein
MWQARPGSSRPSRKSTSASGSPATNSMTRNSSPPAPWPKSVTEMMLGWESRLADCASRSKRRAASWTLLNSGRKSLSASTFFIRVCSTRKHRSHPAFADAAKDAIALADDGVDEGIPRDSQHLGGCDF